MAFTVTTVNSEKAWALDTQFFAPVDVVPNAMINQCSTVAGSIEGDEPAATVAYVDDDLAVFKAEGAELDEAEPDLAEVLVHTAKITQLIRLSNEQFSQEGTDAQLAQSVSLAITRRVNLAFVAEVAPTPPAVAPVAGLVNVENVVDGGDVSESLDALVDLVAELQSNLSVPTHILTDPFGWAELRKFKVGIAMENQSLLGAGTNDAKPMLLSLPVIVDPSVPRTAELCSTATRLCPR